MSRTSSERLMYVQFTSCVYGEISSRELKMLKIWISRLLKTPSSERKHLFMRLQTLGILLHCYIIILLYYYIVNMIMKISNRIHIKKNRSLTSVKMYNCHAKSDIFFNDQDTLSFENLLNRQSIRVYGFTLLFQV